MTTTAVPAPAPLIGHYVPEIQSLAKRGLLWAVVYGVFARAGGGGCLGDGPTETAGDAVCYSVTLHPSPLVWLAMAAVFVLALGRAAKAAEPAAIRRILSRAATALWLIPVVSAVISVWTFMATTPEAWVHGTPPPNVTVQITPE